MSRRYATALATAATLAIGLSPLALHADAATPLKYPKAKCFTSIDSAKDAVFEVAPNNPDLDVTGFALETTTSKHFLAFAKIAALKTGPGSTDGARYTLDFTFNNHVFSASASTYSHGTSAVRQGLASTGQAGHVVQLGVDVPPIAIGTGLLDLVTKDRGFKTSGLKVTFDTKKSWVIFDLPIKDIVKYGGAPFTGTLASVDVKTGTDEYAVSSIWDYAPDSAATGAGTAWTVGTNTCFPVVKKK